MEELTFKYNNFKVQVYKKGLGKMPIVFIHGAGLDSAMLSWEEVINSLDDKYTAYAIDLLGYGKSDKYDALIGEDFYPTHIDTVHSIINQLGLNNFILVGLSMGGAISIGYTLKYPTKVISLIPVDSWGLVNKMPYHSLYYWFIHHTNMTSCSYKLMSKSRFLVEWSIKSSLFSKGFKINPQLVDTIYNLCQDDTLSTSMVNFQRSSITKYGIVPNYLDNLSSLKVPTLFVNGEKDSLVTMKSSIEASKKVDNSNYYVLKDCKHWAIKENPKEFISAIEKFLFDKGVLL